MRRPTKYPDYDDLVLAVFGALGAIAAALLVGMLVGSFFLGRACA